MRRTTFPSLRTCTRSFSSTFESPQRAGGVLARVLPEGGPGEWWRARLAEQAAELPALAGLGPVHRIDETATAPSDITALTALLDG